MRGCGMICRRTGRARRLARGGASGESLVLHLCLLSFVLKAFVFCPSSFVLKGKRTKDKGQKTKDVGLWTLGSWLAQKIENY